MKISLNDKRGFTLVELLVAVTISVIVLSGMYAAYQMQLRSNITQEAVVEMQQNIRGAMYFLERDIRMAGCDPTCSSGAGIQTALANSLAFSMDITGGQGDGLDNDNDGTVDEDDESRFPDGDTNDNGEQVRYGLSYHTDGSISLGRDTGSGLQPLARNIDAVNFIYLDRNRMPTVDLTAIRTVQVTIVARSGREVPVLMNKITDNQVYTNQQGQIILPAQNDNFRRIVLTASIQCRNLNT
jgi:type IV pilus assembly protein PilW